MRRRLVDLVEPAIPYSEDDTESDSTPVLIPPLHVRSKAVRFTCVRIDLERINMTVALIYRRLFGLGEICIPKHLFKSERRCLYLAGFSGGPKSLKTFHKPFSA